MKKDCDKYNVVNHSLLNLFLLLYFFLLLFWLTTSRVVIRVPCFSVEVVIAVRLFWEEFSEELSNSINSHAADLLVVNSASDINGSWGSFLLSDDKDVVPLRDLSVSDFLGEGQVGLVKLNFKALLVQVEMHFLSVFQELLWDWDYDGLSGGDPEGPFASQVLY